MPSKEYMKEYRRKKNPKILEKEELAQQEKKRCTKCSKIKSFNFFVPQKPINFLKRKRVQLFNIHLKFTTKERLLFS